MTPEFWNIVVKAADLDDGLVVAHGIGAAIAAWRFDQGRAMSDQVQRQAWSAAFAEMSALLMLDRIAPYVVDPVVVIKGAEVAASYPSPSQRVFSDVDLLSADAASLHRRLIEAGFQQPGVDAAPGHHHLPALVSPGLDAVVEVHSDVGTFPWLTPPSVPTLIERSAPSRCHQAFRRLDDADHALLLQAHAVSARGLPTLRDALDIAAVTTDWDDVGCRARSWDAARLVTVTRRLIGALADGSGGPVSRRLAEIIWRRPPPEHRSVTRAAAIGFVAGPIGLERHLTTGARRLEESTRPGAPGGSPGRDRIRNARSRFTRG